MGQFWGLVGVTTPLPRPGAPRPCPRSSAGRRLSPPRPRPAPISAASSARARPLGLPQPIRREAGGARGRCHGSAEPLPPAVSSAAMAALRGRALLAPLGARLRAGPRAPLRSAASAPPLYDVVVSGGGMVGSAMAAVLGKAVTRSPTV